MMHEILHEFEQAKTKDDKIAVLRKHGDKSFQLLMFYAFSPDIVFDATVPEYRAAKEPAGLNHMYLHSEVNRLYNFIVGHPKRAPGITTKKQQQLLAIMLESLFVEEAKLLADIISRKFKVKSLDIKILKETYPHIAL
jgi:hypothetical protein